jgi:uncharacterized protein with NRDE domain
MCVIYFALNIHNHYTLILLANRDEFYARPTKAAAYWDNFPHIYGGRDLQGGGTWMGVTDGGRFAAVTNYRDPSAPTGSRSRGDLVAEFLESETSPESYLADVSSNPHEFSGFNLLIGEFSRARCEMHYYSNREGEPRMLTPGIYGLSNHLLDTPWPKVAKGKARFTDVLSADAIDNGQFFELLADKTLGGDDELPTTGIPYEAEKALSAINVKMPGYGTRGSTVLTFDRDLKWNLEERVFV